MSHPIINQKFGPTPIEYELQLYEFHINQVGSYKFVSETHPDIFQFNEVSLKGIVEMVFESQKFGYLKRILTCGFNF